MITKKEAWKKRPDECSIPVDMTECWFKFTRRWFKFRNQTTFSTFLPKRFPSDQPWKSIQIGVFEGYDLAWQMQNLFRHPDSRVIAIDPWEATTKLDQSYMDAVYDRAKHNLRKWRNQIELVRGYSQEVLKNLASQPHEQNSYDLVIIDGDHNAPGVYEDAVWSYELVKPGGWLLFDDVRNQRPKKHHVQEGLDNFMSDYEGRVKRIWYHRFCDCLEKL